MGIVEEDKLGIKCELYWPREQKEIKCGKFLVKRVGFTKNELYEAS